MKPLFDESVRMLFRVRFIRVVDVLFALAATGLFLFLTIRLVFGRCGVPELVCFLGLDLLLTLWLIMLAFRACYYVLQCRADVNMMVPEAAKLVHAYLGGVPQPPAGQ